jgi:ABC-type branched-subunit amino acid transport system substrate-binding protein
MGRSVEKIEEPATVHEPEDVYFFQAEDLFNQNKVSQALADYARYLAQFPRGRHSAKVLGLMGSIYRRQGELDTALAFYYRLVNEFGDNKLADEGRIAIVELLTQQQRPQEAIAEGTRLLGSNMGEPARRVLWQRMIELHDSSGDSANALLYQYRFYKAADKKGREELSGRMLGTIAKLKPTEIELVWDKLEEDIFRSELLFRYGVSRAMADNYDDALEALSTFVKDYPQNANIAEARKIIVAISGRLEFAPLTLGCLLPLSGSYKLYGTRALNGIELALSLMQSGPTPVPIKLVIKDTASDDIQAAKAVKELAEAKVGAILGPMTTAPAAASEAQKLQIPMITFTQKSDITNVGDYIFRHFITPQHQVHTLAHYLIRNLGARDFAILYPNEPYGKTFMGLFWDEVIRQGGRVVAAESYDAKDTDFTIPIKKLKGGHYRVPSDLAMRSPARIVKRSQESELPEAASLLSDPVNRASGLYHQDYVRSRGKNIAGSTTDEGDSGGRLDFEVLFIPDAPKKAGLIIPQLAYNDINGVILVGTNLWHSPQLIEMSKGYLDSAIMVDGFFQNSHSEVVRQFAQTYRDIYGTDPGIIEAFAFDAARLMFKVLGQPDVKYRHTLRNLILQTSLADGVTGSTSFDEKREAVKQLFLLGVKGREFFEISAP